MERIALSLVMLMGCLGLLAATPTGHSPVGALPGLGALVQPVMTIQSMRIEDLGTSRSPERVRRSLRRLERVQRSLDPGRWARRLRRAENRYLAWQRETFPGL